MKTIIHFFTRIQLLFRAKWYFSIPSQKKIILYGAKSTGYIFYEMLNEKKIKPK